MLASYTVKNIEVCVYLSPINIWNKPSSKNFASPKITLYIQQCEMILNLNTHKYVHRHTHKYVHRHIHIPLECTYFICFDGGSYEEDCGKSIT